MTKIMTVSPDTKTWTKLNVGESASFRLAHTNIVFTFTRESHVNFRFVVEVDKDSRDALKLPPKSES